MFLSARLDVGLGRHLTVLGLLALLFTALGVGGRFVELFALHAHEGIAVDAPGGEPTHLRLQGRLQAARSPHRLVMVGEGSGQWLRVGWQVQGELAPGVEAVDEVGSDVKLFLQAKLHHSPAVPAQFLGQSLHRHFQRCALSKSVGVHCVQGYL
ncbi:hypothetical protein D9M69_578720 [compost metagenome]